MITFTDFVSADGLTNLPHPGSSELHSESRPGRGNIEFLLCEVITLVGYVIPVLEMAAKFYGGFPGSVRM